MVNEETVSLKIAKRFVELFNLTPPYNLEELVRQFADLIYKEIPFENVDGVTLHLKVPGRKPKIIVNSDQSPNRLNFTLAHELGHVIIPWHIGTIVDDAHSKDYNNFLYSIQEKEANEFAAEILMPSGWIHSLILTKENYAEIHNHIISMAKVSAYAASIKLIQALPTNSIFILENFSKVIASGKSTGTSSLTQNINEEFEIDFYKHIENYSSVIYGSDTYHWYKLNDKITLASTESSGDWNAIIIEILTEIYSAPEIVPMRKSILSMISYAHSRLTLQGEYSFDDLVTKSVKRLNRSELKAFVNHSRFEDFIKARCEFLINKSKN